MPTAACSSSTRAAGTRSAARRPSSTRGCDPADQKNSLFYKTENGARVGDIFMSLIQTAELSGVAPFDYLVELLRHARDIEEAPGEWLPWNYKLTLAHLTEEAAQRAKG